MDASALRALPMYVFRRTFDAPIELVWAAWTEPAQLSQWWGPKGFVNPRCEFEALPGGKVHIDMAAPDGRVYPLTGKVVAADAPRRLVFACAALSADGRTLFDEINEIEFEEGRGATSIIVKVRIVAVRDAAAHRYLKGAEEGWNQSLDRLRSVFAPD